MLGMRGDEPGVRARAEYHRDSVKSGADTRNF